MTRSNNNTLPFAGEPDVTGVAARINGLTVPEVNDATADRGQRRRASAR